MPGAMGTAFFALCGVLRLARVNVTHVTGPCQGLPIPAGGMALAALVIADVPLPPKIAAAAMMALGVLMISTVPYGNLKLLRKGNVNRAKALIVAMVIISCFATLRENALMALIGIYIASGPLGIDWGAWLAKHRDAGENPAHEKD
jgi:CDP-diacylglycerol--serine O-phosphatidyltransferase